MARILLIAFILPFTLSVKAQSTDTVFYENFNGASPAFILNDAVLGGVSAATGYNQWEINNSYTGGSGQVVCLGFPATFTIPNTPAEPVGTAGGTQSAYLHITSDVGLGVGVSCCSYQAADGFCTADESYFSAMSSDVSTLGYDSVSVSFIWLCAGGANIYGELYYSVDGGVNWILVTTPNSQYKNQSTWATRQITLPAFAGQSTLRFGFRFVNQVSFTANDPGFGIDELMITGSVNAIPPIAQFSVSDSTVCAGDCITFNDLSQGSPTSWLWILQGSSQAFSTVQNPTFVCYTTPGTYPVTLIVNAPGGSDTITVNNAITVTAPPSNINISVSGDTLLAPPGYASYQWYLNGAPIAGADSAMYVSVAGGDYTVSVTDTNNCTGYSSPVSMTTGIYDLYPEKNVRFLPNPSDGIFKISDPISGNLQITDARGKMIENICQNTITEIDLTQYPSGVYFLKVLSETSLVVYRLVKL